MGGGTGKGKAAQERAARGLKQARRVAKHDVEAVGKASRRPHAKQLGSPQKSREAPKGQGASGQGATSERREARPS
eukprot:6856422-Prymnesium_polylepis.1